MSAHGLEGLVIGVFGLSGVLLGALAVVVFRYRDARGTREFSAVLAVSSVWSLSAALKLPAPRQLEAVLVSLEPLYGVAFAVAFLTFAAEYTGHRFHRRRVYALSAGAYLVVVLVAIAGTPTYDLLWANLGLSTVGFPHLYYQGRALPYWLLIGVSYLLYVAGVSLLFDLLRRTRFNTGALALIALGVLAPVLVNLASIVDQGPVPGLDYTPFGLVVFGLATTAALSRDLFAIAPIARDTAVEHSSEAMVILDADRRIRDANPTARQLFPGLEGATGGPVGTAVPAEAVTFDRERTRRSETTLPIDGVERTVAVTTAPIREGAHHLGWTLVASDVTELKRRERHLELVARVLRHNLSNEITVIQGQTQLLRGRLDDELAGHLDRIADSGRRIITTSEKVRTIQEIVTDDRGPRPTNLSEYVDSAVARMEETYPDAEVVTDEGDVWVRSGVGLAPAIENLMENAIVHAGADRPRVALEVTADESTVTVAVLDDGPGIPPDEQRILQEGETPLRHSSGVGLWLVYRYVERFGRDLTFTRRPGGGSRVSFVLDRADAPEE